MVSVKRLWRSLIKKNDQSANSVHRFIVSIDEAEEIADNLHRAIDEAEDHQMVQCAFMPSLGLSIYVNPHLDRYHRFKNI